MKNVTVTMDEVLLKRARVAAAYEGKSLSKYIAETVEQRVGRPISQSEALAQFLAGPPLHVLDEKGRAPPRGQRYDE